MLSEDSDSSLEKEIIASVENDVTRLTDLTSTLVRFPSLLGNEKSAQDYMENLFKEMGLSVERFPVYEKDISKLPGYSPTLGDWDGHDNVVGTHVPKNHFGQSLILNGHIDVVPVGAEELWSHPPFQPVVRDGRIYGRGSGDMKAGIACYVTAFRALTKLGLQPSAPVFLQSVVEEECTGNGALACLGRGYTADAAIIPEPFNETIMSGQMGVMWIKLEVYGKPAHVLNDKDGVSAIEGAYLLWKDLKTLATQWNKPKNRHPLFAETEDPAKFNLGKIKGGEWASSVPTRCEMDIRIGFFPDIKTQTIQKQIEEHLVKSKNENPQLKNIMFKTHYGGFQSEGCVVDKNSKMIDTLSKSHETIFGAKPEWFPSAATTDAKIFNLYGNTPATCYGPEAKDIHGIDESVSIASMLRVTSVLAVFLSRWCGTEKI